MADSQSFAERRARSFLWARRRGQIADDQSVDVCQCFGGKVFGDGYSEIAMGISGLGRAHRFKPGIISLGLQRALACLWTTNGWMIFI